MMPNHKTTAIALVLFAVHAVTAQDISSRVNDLREKLRQNQEVVPGSAQQRSNRDEMIAYLIEIVRQEQTRGEFGSVYQRAVAALGDCSESSKAVQALIDSIDEPPSPAARLTQAPLEHFHAAKALTRGGRVARSRLLDALSNPQSPRRLHLIAFVLAALDQTEARQYSVDLTILRLVQESKWVETSGMLEGQAKESRVRNLEQVMLLLLQPQFSVSNIPPNK